MRMPAKGSGTTLKVTPEELRRLRESMPDLITDQFETIGAAADGCDVILGANAHQYAAPSIAKREGIGCVTAVYSPVALPSLHLRPPPIDDVLEYVLTDHTWVAADAALAPVPATPGRKIFQTGTWVLADRTPLPADLEAFLESGEPPILVGFGSMPAGADASRQLIGAVRAAGRRILVSRGWAGLDLIDNAPDCMAVGDVSYDLLFPRVATVVHYGGAGTTAAGARAGIPQVITPMFGDQFYWASRIVDLGIGATTPYSTMTEESLTGALREALDPAAAVRARTLVRQVRWDGAAVAAQQLEVEYGAAGN
jgi:vancomycin aglycone glucosyltransferase